MGRGKVWLDIDVLTAAKERIRKIADRYDNLCVSFSGGKDSLTVLHLTREVLAERGVDIVPALFFDEELIPQRVIDFVDEYRRKPWVRMLYFAVPLESNKFVLGRGAKYIQWGPGRPWAREKPEWAILPREGDDTVYSQYTLNAWAREYFEGSVAFLLGLRADESLLRYRSVVSKVIDPEIHERGPGKAVCNPIYDWTENDIFKYLYENRIQYCTIYDHQLFARAELRVATPIHSEAAKRIGKLRQIDPELYEKVVEIFPDMVAQDLYWKDMDRGVLFERYAGSVDGIREYIEEYYTEPEAFDLAMQRYAEVMLRHKSNPGGYPLKHILGYFMGGGIKRNCLPSNEQAVEARRKKNEL